MSKSDGGAAFACAAENGHQPGMTMRQAYKIAALSMMRARTDGEYSKSDHEYGTPTNEAKWVVSAASRMADEMIAEDLAFAERGKNTSQ